MLSAKTGGAAGGDWGPTALSWGLGAEGGALWEEDAAEKSCPHSLCPRPAHHVHGRKAQLGEKVQPGFEQPRVGGSSSPASPGSEELGERSCPVITAGPLWRGCCVTQESMPTPEPAETSSGKGLFADVTQGSGDEIPGFGRGLKTGSPGCGSPEVPEGLGLCRDIWAGRQPRWALRVSAPICGHQGRPRDRGPRFGVSDRSSQRPITT